MGTQSRSMDRCRPFYMHIMHIWHIDHIHSRYKGIVHLSAFSLFASSDHIGINPAAVSLTRHQLHLHVSDSQ